MYEDACSRGGLKNPSYSQLTRHKLWDASREVGEKIGVSEANASCGTCPPTRRGNDRVIIRKRPVDGVSIVDLINEANLHDRDFHGSEGRVTVKMRLDVRR